MQLAKYTDYALRVLMHLAVAAGESLSTRQIADLQNIKYNHLSKVTQWLVREGYASSNRGRGGGLTLAKPAEEINIGILIRKLESRGELVECLRKDGGHCVLAPSCGLTQALINAEMAFFKSLEKTMLSDITTSNSAMSKLLEDLNAS